MAALGAGAHKSPLLKSARHKKEAGQGTGVELILFPSFFSLGCLQFHAPWDWGIRHQGPTCGGAWSFCHHQAPHCGDPGSLSQRQEVQSPAL